MSGIFRAAFRMPQLVQSPLAALSAAVVGGGAISPAHAVSDGASFAPSLRRSLSATLLGGAQVFAAPVVRVTLRPVSVGSLSAYFDAVVDAGASVAPGVFANGSSFGATVLRIALLPQALAAAGSVFHAAVDDGDLLSPASLTNAQSFGALRLTLRLSPTAYANAASAYAPVAGPAGVMGAPLVASGSAIHAPRVDGAHVFEVVGTLSVAGWTPRPAARKPRVAAWPNLPKVEAPPWRLIVVTPEVARERARSLMAQRRRYEQARRARGAKRKLSCHLDEIIEAEIAHIVVRLVGEGA